MSRRATSTHLTCLSGAESRRVWLLLLDLVAEGFYTPGEAVAVSLSCPSPEPRVLVESTFVSASWTDLY